MNGSRSFELVNGDSARPVCRDNTASFGQQSRQDHTVHSPATSPPSIIVTDLSRNDLKVFRSDALFEQTDDVDCLYSGHVRQNICRTGNSSVPVHSVRWSDPLTNSCYNRDIWKVCFHKYFKLSFVHITYN